MSHPYKLGARHRPQPLAIRPLSERASLHLMIPPIAADWHRYCPPDNDPLGNDRLGLCVEVADARIIQIHKAVVWNDPTKPKEADIIARYAAETGYNPATGAGDNGTDTVEDMTAWSTRGIAITDQTKDIPRWARANPQDQAEVNLSIAHAGPVAVTIALPLAFQNLSVWDQAPGVGPQWQPAGWGFHRVMCGKFDAGFRTLRTWGRDLVIHPDSWSRFVAAVDVVLSREWLDTTGLSPTGLDLDALDADMAALSPA